MNKYLVYVTGVNDTLGFSFLENVVSLTKQGAVLAPNMVHRCSFPHGAWMILESEEEFKSKPGYQVQIIFEDYTREELDDMEWEKLKKVVKQRFGITSRDRNVLINKYLAQLGESSSEDKVE